MTTLPWPSLQSLFRAAVLALVTFALWELPAADTVQATASLF